MVDYVGTTRIAELLSQVGTASFMAALAGEIEVDFRRWHDFDKSPRHAVHSAVGVIELMPISDSKLYTFKYVNGHPRNTHDGLLTVTAFGILADVATGYPLLLSEMTYITALRTAAISALAAQKMARPNSHIMAMIGNGAQSEFQILAFHRMLGIREVRLFDTDKAATEKLLRNLSALKIPDLKIVCSKSTAEAVQGADIVTTVTADKRNALILTPEMIEPGMHLNAVGGDCPGKTELHVEILRRSDARIVVEYEPQARIEGEIQQLKPSEPVIELTEVLCGTKAGRATEHEVTIFDSVGFALNDFSALRYVYKLNREQSVGRALIDLVPLLDDPKNLWGGLTGTEKSQPTAIVGKAPTQHSALV